MIISLYFLVIGGVFYRFYIKPPNETESQAETMFPLIQTRPIVNKKAAKPNV